MFETFRYFLYLGVTGFGGPLMLIQQMRISYVEQKKLISSEEFDQAFTLIKAMPGPIAFQMAVFLGNRFHRLGGAVLAGIGLLLPSFLMMLVMGYFYKSFVEISFVNPILEGFLFSVSAVILLSLKSLVMPSYKKISFWVLVLLSLALAWGGQVPEPLIIVGFGLLTVLLAMKRTATLFSAAPLLVADWGQVYDLFKVCLYGGAFVFGTGFALLPVLRTNFVDIHHWITLKEFNDGVIFGQMTPGPITITGAFLGFQISGLVGALAATIGIFFMPFVHMTTWFPHAVKWLARQNWIQNFLAGATAAVVGAILATVLKMNLSSYSRWMFWILFSATLLILLRKPKTSLLLIIFSAGVLNLIVNLFAMNAV